MFRNFKLFAKEREELTFRCPGRWSSFRTLLLAATVITGFAATAWAATITVTTTSDENVANTACSLREAIIAANNNSAYNGCPAGSGADTIVLSAQTYTLSLDASGGNEDGGSEDDLDVVSEIVIEGNGAIIERSTAVPCNVTGALQAGEFRLMHVIGPGGNLTVRNVWFRNGCADGSGDDGNAAGIFNNGGMLTVVGCTFSNNAAYNYGGAGRSVNGTATFLNSTITGNSAWYGPGLDASSGSLNLSFVTFSGNTSQGSAALRSGSLATLNVKNVVLANNTYQNCSFGGPTNKTGSNYSTDTSCTGFTQVSNAQINLGSLANNGGPTPTVALLSGSAAIDAVSDCTAVGGAAVSTDQRGAVRPQGSKCDAGAFEFGTLSSYTLTVQISPSGAGSVAGNGIACPSDCSESFSSSTTVTLTATANAGYSFASWSGCTSTAGNSCTVSVNGNKSVTASFTQTGGGGGDDAYQYWIPVVANAAGSGGTYFYSDVSVLNVGVAPVTVNFAYSPTGGGTFTGASQQPLPVGGQGVFRDVVGQLNKAGTKGVLRVSGSQPLKVVSRTYNKLSSGNSLGLAAGTTFGQYIEAYPLTETLSGGQVAYLVGLTQNGAYRTNIAVANFGSAVASVTVTLYTGTGQQLTSYTVSLNPGELKQENEVFATKAGQTNLESGWAKVVVNSGSGVVAYASVLDNTATNNQKPSDPTTIPFKR